MDKTMLLMMLAQNAPRVLAMLKNSVDNAPVENIENLLQNKGYDTGIMEETAGNILSKLNKLPEDSYQRTSLEPIDFLQGQYSTDIFENGTSGAFPSDGINPQSLAGLFEKLSPQERAMLGGSPAELSAATFMASPEQNQSPVIDLGGFLNDYNSDEYTDVPGHQLVDSDLDDIHSSEMWEAGKKFNPSLKEWYKKNKR